METAVVWTRLDDSRAAGYHLGEQISASLSGAADAVIVFASPRYDHAALLGALQNACSPAIIVGSSSAGEFTSELAIGPLSS